MRERPKRVRWLLYPEDTFKQTWDLIITFILIVSCFITPFRLAFDIDDESLKWKVIGYLIDCMFLVEMIVNFNSAYYD
jgi:hypothetical protein